MKIFAALAFLLCSPALADTITVSITRPNNTTQYTANTGWANATSGAVSTPLKGFCKAVSGGAGVSEYLTDVEIIDGANQSTQLAGLIYIFDSPPSSPISDNATWNLATADVITTTVTVPFTLANVSNAGSGAAGSQTVLASIGAIHTCVGGGTAWLMVEVTNTYTPVANEVLTIRLKYEPLN